MLGLQVEGEALLAPMQGIKEEAAAISDGGRLSRPVTTSGSLDLDDFGTKIGEDA
jgi:hypothetical protein